MTKDLHRINAVEINKQKKKLDSLYTIYQIFEQNKKTDKLKELENELRKEDQELKNMGEYVSSDVSQKVWERLNTYIQEYGETHGFNIVLGTHGNGNVMYADKTIDVTDAILEYSNAKYEGN